MPNNVSPRNSKTRKAAEAEGYRSGFEQRQAAILNEAGVPFRYEPDEEKVTYNKPPPRPSVYLPDFVLDNGIIVEAKGRFTPRDRQKHLYIKKQRPDLDIRFVFQYDNKLSRKTETRYSDWCNKNGFKFAIGEIPVEWAQERGRPGRTVGERTGSEARSRQR